MSQTETCRRWILKTKKQNKNTPPPKKKGGGVRRKCLCAGFSCRKQQNCELNLDSDERTWAGTPDISQICGPLSFIVLLTSLALEMGHCRIHLVNITEAEVTLDSVFQQHSENKLEINPL